MEFTKILIKGKLIKRYKRFFAEVKLDKEIVTAHCPNTGSMQGLLKKGNKVWITKSDNPNRKLRYTLQIIEDKGVKVFVDSAAIMYLLGTEMDYKKEELSSSFVFNNPNETERCGCGESFKVE